MISWVVASHDPTILYTHLVASMWDLDGDELVVVESAPSIARAYNDGQARARWRLRCYVHHDVAFLDLPRLRAELVAAATPQAGMVGLIGSRTPVLPWWDGDPLGSVHDARIGAINYGDGGPCSTLDGLLLATVHDLDWDEALGGWHGYDYDACRQMGARGLHNVCLTGGAAMVRHNTTGSRDPDELAGWTQAVAYLRSKWEDG